MNFYNIVNIKKLEKVTAFGNVKKVATYNKKWDITNRKLPLQSKVRFAMWFYLGFICGNIETEF